MRTFDDWWRDWWSRQSNVTCDRETARLVYEDLMHEKRTRALIEPYRLADAVTERLADVETHLEIQNYECAEVAARRLEDATRALCCHITTRNAMGEL